MLLHNPNEQTTISLFLGLSKTPSGIVHSHLADEPILIDTLSLSTLWLLRPHLLHIFQDHIAVSIEGLYPRQQLSVIPAGDQDLGVGAGGGLQDRKRPGGKLMFFDDGDFIFTVRTLKRRG